MNENVKPTEAQPQATDQPKPQKRGRKGKDFYEQNAPVFYKRFFKLFREIEKNHSKFKIEKPQILQIAREQGIPQSLAELIINIIEMHMSCLEQKQILADIKAKIS